MNLRSGLIAAQMYGLRFAVREVDDCLAARCDDCHIVHLPLFVHDVT